MENEENEMIKKTVTEETKKAEKRIIIKIALILLIAFLVTVFALCAFPAVASPLLELFKMFLSALPFSAGGALSASLF